MRAFSGGRQAGRAGIPATARRMPYFLLDNTYLELLAVDGEGPGAKQVRRALGDREGALAGLVFGVEDVAAFLEQARGAGLPVSDPAPGEGVDERSGRRRSWQSLFWPASSARGIFPLRSSMTRRASSRPGPRAGRILLALLIMWWCRPKMPRQRSVFMETRLAFVLPLKRSPRLGRVFPVLSRRSPYRRGYRVCKVSGERSVMGHRFTDPRS